MARIRTIKPEFPQSESIGRLSREARLCFVLLWTLSDDSGRLRGNSRMLASLLYPYDDDAKELIDGWLAELECERCVVRYQVEGETYLEICNWLKHQKIDKPSQSKIPPIPGGFAKPREDSKKNAADQGRDQGRDQGKAQPGPRAFSPPPWIPSEAWAGFEEHRKKIRKPMTDKARALIVRELEKLKPDDPVEVIEQSIRNGWQDVFALRQKSGVAKETALRADL